MNGFQPRLLEMPTGHMACWSHPKSAGKPLLLMGHGNGLSALCQIELMAALAPHFDVQGLDFRGHGASAGHLPLPGQPANPWGYFLNDLECVIDQHFGGRVRFAGHSLSAVVALRLARRRPQIFERLVCLDPPILSHSLARIYPLVRRSNWLSQRNHLYMGARKRRARWPDAEAARAYFTGRKAFATWPKSTVAAYVESCLIEAEDGSLTLACPRDWEARTFRHIAPETAWALKHIQTPTTLLRANQGSMRPKHLELGPNMALVDIPGSHFAHLEHPEAVASLIHQHVLDKIPQA